MTFLTKGGLIERVAPKQYKATPRGAAFLQKYAVAITANDLRKIEGWKDAWGNHQQELPTSSESESEGPETPLERIEEAEEIIKAELRGRLLSAILEKPPAFFEQLVLDVVLSMGYGGSKEDAAKHLGRSGDEGIDGRINQDTLGLDQVLIQAKRYRPDRVVDRQAIQAFVGSLAGQGVTKGIFITTSRFADTAHEFVLRGSTTKVVLMDGEMLLDQMIKHRIGVRPTRQLELLDLDQNYFEDE